MGIFFAQELVWLEGRIFMGKRRKNDPLLVVQAQPNAGPCLFAIMNLVAHVPF